MSQNTPRITLKCALSGALAGAANGFFGAGGGMLLVPGFTRLAKIDDKRAYASSLAVILPLSLVSGAIHLVRGTVSLGGAAPYLLGGLLGGFIGGRVFRKIPAGVLRRIFGALLIYGGIRCLL